MLDFAMLPFAVTTAAAASLTIWAMAMVATMANPKLQPAAYPFAPGSADPAADTLVGQGQIETVFSEPQWTSLTLSSLSEVETLLDRLEACRVPHREVITMGNAAFCVRWKLAA